MNKTKILPLALGLALLLFVTPAFADTVSVDFESYTLGSISGQDGWGNAVNPAYDQEVVNNTYGYSSFDSKSFRMSDEVASGSFGDWVFVKPLTNAVGETAATTGGFTEGTRQRHFEMQFDIASTMPNAQQTGLHMSVSPDRGDGSRMSYLRFEDSNGGIDVFFDDVQGTINVGDTGCPVSPPTYVLGGKCANFVETQVGTDLSRTAPHTIKLTMDTLDGASNDVVKVYIDGVLVHTGQSWEDYYRFDAEAQAEQSPRIVKTMIMQVRGSSNPGNAGNGFLFDNINLSSGPIPHVNTGTITNPAANGDHVSGITNFTALYDDGDAVNDDAVHWAIRTGTSCTTGTVFGNVDGHTDSSTWDGSNFSAMLDTSSLTPGEYCFVFNPTDDAGENDVRETRTFFVDSPFAVPAACQNIPNLGAPIIGTNGTDKISGTSGNDLIFALGGSDKVDGKGGNDCIVGGDGSDKLSGGTGNDVILGGNGSDSLKGEGGDDRLYGDNDSDSLSGGTGDDFLYGGNGSDSLKGDSDDDTLDGEAGSDSAKGGSGTDTCTAEAVNQCEL